MFPCHYVQRSKCKPDCVHKLQPGDIDVVAALGDSLTGGTGALGRNLGDLRTEYRGVTFSIGRYMPTFNKKMLTNFSAKTFPEFFKGFFSQITN